jgi:ferrochelatase
MHYAGEPAPHGEIPATGVLLSNLGTPDAPTPAALRRYLREFLSDPRVIELPRWKWWPILNFLVLPRRAPKSAAAYREVWTPQGSPLLLTARKQRDRVEALLRARFGSPLHVALGMRYGNPSLASAVDELARKGCRRILLFPLYPQYAAATTASTFDAVFAALSRRRFVPELRTIASYHDDPLYIGALARSVREAWREGEPERLLLSFHGIPKRYFEAGDPYYCHCQKTARLLAEELGLARERWFVTFQSRFGREEWLKPYTDETLRSWTDVKSVDVLCPGFSADCLETIEEIDQQNREFFEEASGGRFRYIAALNDRDDHAAALAAIAARHLEGWAVPREAWDEAKARADAEASKRRADA